MALVPDTSSSAVKDHHPTISILRSSGGAGTPPRNNSTGTNNLINGNANGNNNVRSTSSNNNSSSNNSNNINSGSNPIHSSRPPRTTPTKRPDNSSWKPQSITLNVDTNITNNNNINLPHHSHGRRQNNTPTSTNNNSNVDLSSPSYTANNNQLNDLQTISSTPGSVLLVNPNMMNFSLTRELSDLSGSYLNGNTNSPSPVIIAGGSTGVRSNKIGGGKVPGSIHQSDQSVASYQRPWRHAQVLSDSNGNASTTVTTTEKTTPTNGKSTNSDHHAQQAPLVPPRQPQHPQPHTDDDNSVGAAINRSCKKLATMGGTVAAHSFADLFLSPSQKSNNFHNYHNNEKDEMAIEVIQAAIESAATPSSNYSKSDNNKSSTTTTTIMTTLADLAKSSVEEFSTSMFPVEEQQQQHRRIPLIVLLMDTNRKLYELLQIWIDCNNDTVRSILHTIQQSIFATGTTFAEMSWRQDYDGIFQVRNNHFSQLIHILTASKYDVQPFELWVAKPWSMSAKATVSHASGLLNHLKRIGVLAYTKAPADNQGSSSNNSSPTRNQRGGQLMLPSSSSSLSSNTNNQHSAQQRNNSIDDTILALSPDGRQRIYIPGGVLKHHHACQFLSFSPPFETTGTIRVDVLAGEGCGNSTICGTNTDTEDGEDYETLSVPDSQLSDSNCGYSLAEECESEDNCVLMIPGQSIIAKKKFTTMFTPDSIDRSNSNGNAVLKPLDVPMTSTTSQQPPFVLLPPRPTQKPTVVVDNWNIGTTPTVSGMTSYSIDHDATRAQPTTITQHPQISKTTSVGSIEETATSASQSPMLGSHRKLYGDGEDDDYDDYDDKYNNGIDGASSGGSRGGGSGKEVTLWQYQRNSQDQASSYSNGNNNNNKHKMKNQSPLSSILRTMARHNNNNINDTRRKRHTRQQQRRNPSHSFSITGLLCCKCNDAIEISVENNDAYNNHKNDNDVLGNDNDVFGDVKNDICNRYKPPCTNAMIISSESPIGRGTRNDDHGIHRIDQTLPSYPNNTKVASSAAANMMMATTTTTSPTFLDSVSSSCTTTNNSTVQHFFQEQTRNISVTNNYSNNNQSASLLLLDLDDGCGTSSTSADNHSTISESAPLLLFAAQPSPSSEWVDDF